MDILPFIRDVADFPRPGIAFKDLTPLLGDAAAFAQVIDALAAPFRQARIERVCAIEARGFVFGAPVATALGCGFVPLRKRGKLPARTFAVDYALEYGVDRIEMHADALQPGQRILLIDDVLATGGTLAAAAAVIACSGARIAAAAVVVELMALRGRERWSGDVPLHAVASLA